MRDPSRANPFILPSIETRRLLLTVPRPEDAPELLAYAIENEAHLGPWEPLRADDHFTEASWRTRIETGLEEFAARRAMRLVLRELGRANGAIVGHANFTNIVLGPFQACHLGYSIDHRHQGAGLMTEALEAAIAYVFGSLELHRVMANYVPTNERSSRLLRRLGFVVEGYARDYLFIAGKWQDHVLTALTNPSSSPPPGRL